MTILETEYGARRRLSAARARELATAFAFLLPALIALGALRLLPAAQSIVSSVQKHHLATDVTSFAGLENYSFLFQSSEFIHSVLITLLFAAIVNPFQIALALGLALVLNERLPAAGLWRTLIFVPIAVPAAISSIIWGIAYRPDGPINAVLATIGIAPQPFLNSSGQALASIIMLLSWIGVGYWMMFLIAGLRDIPSSYYEAFAVDGGNRRQSLLRITLPLLRRPLAFVLVADTIANFVVFAPVQILTRGGPASSTDVLIYDIYDQAYQKGDVHLAAAEVVLLVIVMLVIVSIQFRLLSTKE